MTAPQGFLLTVGAVFGLTAFVLALAGDDSIDHYYVAFMLEYLGAMAVFPGLKDAARRVLGYIGVALQPGFLLVVGLHIASIVLR